MLTRCWEETLRDIWGCTTACTIPKFGCVVCCQVAELTVGQFANCSELSSCRTHCHDCGADRSDPELTLSALSLRCMPGCRAPLAPQSTLMPLRLKHLVVLTPTPLHPPAPAAHWGALSPTPHTGPAAPQQAAARDTQQQVQAAAAALLPWLAPQVAACQLARSPAVGVSCQGLHWALHMGRVLARAGTQSFTRLIRSLGLMKSCSGMRAPSHAAAASASSADNSMSTFGLRVLVLVTSDWGDIIVRLLTG